MSERREQFERDGFLVLPEFASAEACAGLRRAIEGLLAEADLEALSTVFDTDGQGHDADDYFLDSGAEVRFFLEPERDGGAKRVNKIGHGMHDRIPEFDRFSRSPALASLVRELGVAEPLLLQSMVILKPPRVGADVPPHQDATFLYTEPVSVIGFWFALEDASVDNGCLQVLPGAHRPPLGGLRQRHHRRGRETWIETLDERPWPEEGWVPLEVSAGTLVVFDGLMPHRSSANRSERSRWAYTIHTIDGAAHYAEDNWLQRPANAPLRGF